VSDVETVEDWIDKIKNVDKVLRDRLFILTVAAEEGWRVAGEVAFAKKGRKGKEGFRKDVEI